MRRPTCAQSLAHAALQVEDVGCARRQGCAGSESGFFVRKYTHIPYYVDRPVVARIPCSLIVLAGAAISSGSAQAQCKRVKHYCARFGGSPRSSTAPESARAQCASVGVACAKRNAHPRALFMNVGDVPQDDMISMSHAPKLVVEMCVFVLHCGMFGAYGHRAH